MPYVWIISNLYGKLEDEKLRSKTIIEWRWLPETEKKFGELGFKPEEIQNPLLNSRLTDKFELLSSQTGMKFKFSKMVAKGIAIRNKFYWLLEKHKISDSDFIVYLDGDGQIHFDHVFKILELLKTNPLVIGKRVGEQGIDKERSIVEKFENSFIEDHFNISLPDAQCGCWGLISKHLKEISPSLSAEGFEVELDVLICSLEKGISPAFTEISVIPPNTSTNFSAGEDNERKLEYLMKRFKIDLSKLIEKSNIFASKYGALPSEYTKIFSSSLIKDIEL